MLKQASPDRIKEVLRVLNFIAAPFGSQEHLLIRYGVRGTDYNLDDNGNPVLTDQGKTDMNFIWPYIVSPAVVLYYPKASEFPQVMQDGEKAMLAAGVEDPTIGLYSPTDVSRGPGLNQGFIEGVADIVVGRRPMSDFDQLVKDWASTPGYNPQLTHRTTRCWRRSSHAPRGVRHRARLGAEMIISGCGSRHPTDFYGPHPDNHTPATRERLIGSLRRSSLRRGDRVSCSPWSATSRPPSTRPSTSARSPGGRFALGPRQLRPGQSARRFLQRLEQRRRDAPHVADPRRLLHEVRPHQGRRRRPEFVVHISEAPPGQGLSTWTPSSTWAQLGEDTAVIVEHLPADQAFAEVWQLFLSAQWGVGSGGSVRA